MGGSLFVGVTRLVTGRDLACVFEYTGADKIEVLPVTAHEVDE